ncbi:YbhB/YbcL family Raf kinase inhibitor-like protein [Streptomyces sp. UP1A-1]|nr:YbhB/YbcL family Raf kinase inhibitor-like protein [Streptomyces sp. UP1A-1]
MTSTRPCRLFTVTSEDVQEGGTLKDAQVYAAGNTSPQLRWEGFPAGTKSFAVTCYDPDAPTGSGFWHWVVFDIPASVTELPHGCGQRHVRGPARGCRAGTQRLRDQGVRRCGAAAGDGPHRYVFTVYAVDQEKLGPDAEATPAFVGFNLRFHTIGRAQLIGEYEVPAEG